MMMYAGTRAANTVAVRDVIPSVSAAPLASGGSDQERITAAVRRTLPSVVAINVTINGVEQVPVDPFGQFYQNVPFRVPASGSGFVISSNGLIVTNAHVVTGGTGRPVTPVIIARRTLM